MKFANFDKRLSHDLRNPSIVDYSDSCTVES